MGDAGPATLPPVARPAWAAYRAMLASKAAHFEYLKQLADKEQQGSRRSLAEVSYLDKLLANHTAAVGEFRAAIASLASQDRAARDVLLNHLSQAPTEEPAASPDTVH